MERKTSFVQIRVSPSQKEALLALAESRGQDLSQFILASVLPEFASKFLDLVSELKSNPKMAFAEVNDLLSGANGNQIKNLPKPDLHKLDIDRANYLAAMIEHAAIRNSVLPPAWTNEIDIPSVPFFASSALSLRHYLLRVSPVAFKARNIFIDSTIGDRV